MILAGAVLWTLLKNNKPFLQLTCSLYYLNTEIQRFRCEKVIRILAVWHYLCSFLLRRKQHFNFSSEICEDIYHIVFTCLSFKTNKENWTWLSVELATQITLCGNNFFYPKLGKEKYIFSKATVFHTLNRSK